MHCFLYSSPRSWFSFLNSLKWTRQAMFCLVCIISFLFIFICCAFKFLQLFESKLSTTKISYKDIYWQVVLMQWDCVSGIWLSWPLSIACMADECASSPASDRIGLLRCNGNAGGMPDGGAWCNMPRGLWDHSMKDLEDGHLGLGNFGGEMLG